VELEGPRGPAVPTAAAEGEASAEGAGTVEHQQAGAVARAAAGMREVATMELA